MIGMNMLCAFPHCNSDHCILTVTKHRKFMEPFVTVDMCRTRRIISHSSIYTSMTKYPLLSMTVQADINCYLHSNLPTAVGPSSRVLQHSLATVNWFDERGRERECKSESIRKLHFQQQHIFHQNSCQWTQDTIHCRHEKIDQSTWQSHACVCYWCPHCHQIVIQSYRRVCVHVCVWSVCVCVFTGGRSGVCVCVCVCVHLCVWSVCLYVCVWGGGAVCVYMCVCTHAHAWTCIGTLNLCCQNMYI